LLGSMAGLGLRPNEITMNSVINACAQARDAPKALLLLGSMSGMGLQPDEITVNTVINACAKAGDAPKAIVLLGAMEGMGLRPNQVTLNSVMKAICRSKRTSFKKQDDFVRIYMRAHGFVPNRFVYFELLLSCTRLPGGEERATEVFDALLADVVDPYSPNLLPLLCQCIGQEQYDVYCAAHSAEFDAATKRTQRSGRLSDDKRDGKRRGGEGAVIRTDNGIGINKGGKDTSRRQKGRKGGKGTGRGNLSSKAPSKAVSSSYNQIDDCGFARPLQNDIQQENGNGKGKGVCRYDGHCTRSGCWFSHPLQEVQKVRECVVSQIAPHIS